MKYITFKHGLLLTKEEADRLDVESERRGSTRPSDIARELSLGISVWSGDCPHSDGKGCCFGYCPWCTAEAVVSILERDYVISRKAPVTIDGNARDVDVRATLALLLPPGEA